MPIAAAMTLVPGEWQVPDGGVQGRVERPDAAQVDEVGRRRVSNRIVHDHDVGAATSLVFLARAGDFPQVRLGQVEEDRDVLLGAVANQGDVVDLARRQLHRAGTARDHELGLGDRGRRGEERLAEPLDVLDELVRVGVAQEAALERLEQIDQVLLPGQVRSK